MSLARLLLLVPLLTVACENPDKDASSDDSGDAVAYGLTVHPGLGGQGTSLEVELEASASFFDYEGVASADFGEGITVDEVTVLDPWTAVATLTIDDDAEVGARDVTALMGSSELTRADGFQVIAESFTLDPDTAYMGETVEVTFLGRNTSWESGITWPVFGDDIEVLDFTVLSETLSAATLVVNPDALPGWRDVDMTEGPETLTLYDGFKVDRVGIAATFDPVEAEQGDTVDFTIYGRGTNFSSASDLSFFDTWGENGDIVVDTITVLDAENLYGRMTLSNAASLGGRDVLVTTDDEGVYIEDAFTVVGGAFSLEDVAISLSFTVVRGIDNATGDMSESVQASCVFFIPLDPACPPDPEDDGSECTDGVDNDDDEYIDCLDSDCSASGVCPGPSPYDVQVTVESPGNGEVDCPSPQTVGAGDYVWLESDANVVTLERYEDTSSGQIYYVASNLTMDDYVPGTTYALHTSGETDGVEEEYIDEALVTVPADWELLSPELWNNFTHNRAEDFTFTWTPALTYPDAIFAASVAGTLVSTGESGAVSSLPWDDGEHAFTADEIDDLDAGGAYFTAYSFIEGPEFGLPESIYQTNTSTSYIYLQAYMVLE